MEKCSQELRISNIEKKLNEDHTTICEIRDALLPSEFHPENGLIKRVGTMQDDITNIQETLVKAKVWILAAGTIFGALFAVAQLIIAVIEK